MRCALLFVDIYLANADSAANKVWHIGEDEYLEYSLPGGEIAWSFYPNIDPAKEREISYMSRLVDGSGKYEIAKEGRSLKVRNVTNGDAGKYVCHSLDGPIPTPQMFTVTVQQLAQIGRPI